MKSDETPSYLTAMSDRPKSTRTADGGSDQRQRLVLALRRIEKDWPKGLMLFANNGNLHLMRGHPEDGGKSLATFTIPSDGGDTFIQ